MASSFIHGGDFQCPERLGAFRSISVHIILELNYLQNGRVWGRRDCNFSVNPGPNSCIDGGCNGGLVCRLNFSKFIEHTLIYPLALRSDNRNGMLIVERTPFMSLKLRPLEGRPTRYPGRV